MVFLNVAHTFAETCPPTRPDSLGPFYEPEAPERSRVGKGYVLEGTVKSSQDCAPLKRAKIELWLTGPSGEYDAMHRATIYSDSSGKYVFESNRPRGYFRRPPHIHILVSAEGYKALITQHYPRKGSDRGVFDLILIPSGD